MKEIKKLKIQEKILEINWGNLPESRAKRQTDKRGRKEKKIREWVQGSRYPHNKSSRKKEERKQEEQTNIKIISNFSDLEAIGYQIERVQAHPRMKRHPYQDTSLWNIRTFLQASREREREKRKQTNSLLQRMRSQIVILLWTLTLGARRQCSNVFKILKDNYFQLRILYPAKLSIKSKIKNKQKNIFRQKLSNIYFPCTLPRKLPK